MKTKTIKAEIKEITKRDCYIDEVSVRELSKRVVREVTEESTYRSVGDQYTRSETSYVVSDNKGRMIEMEGGWLRYSRRLVVWLGLLARSEGSIPLAEQENFVPVKIAASGKPELASYLYVVHDMEREKVGDFIGVSEQTVNQYLSDISHGRREKS